MDDMDERSAETDADEDIVVTDANPPAKRSMEFRFPSWAAIGGGLGGIAAIVAILQFLGITHLTDVSFNFGSRDVSGSFISFRDTDFQITLKNGSSEQQFVSDAVLTLESAEGATEVRMATCCGLDSNVLPPQQDSTPFMRSSAMNSNFGFYYDVLLPLKDAAITGSISLTISRGQGETYPVILEIPSERLTSWKDERVNALHSMCENWNGTKPQWCS